MDYAQPEHPAQTELVFLAGGKGVALVDPADVPLVVQHRWRLSRGHAITEVYRDGTRTSLSMHRLLAGAEPGQIVDHRNGDRLDNRRANLRTASHTENNQNAKARRAALSRYRGVWMGHGRWRAVISANNSRHYLGYFSTEQAAAIAYDVAALRLHGRFARTNIL